MLLKSSLHTMIPNDLMVALMASDSLLKGSNILSSMDDIPQLGSISLKTLMPLLIKDVIKLI